jgi:hypothetical protein
MSQTNGTRYDLYHPVAAATATAPPLPEAPASVNVHLMISGRQVQLTLRDTDEGRLLARLQTVLAQYPLDNGTNTCPVNAPRTAQEGWCVKHGVQMQPQSKEGRSWWSHRQDGQWCKGK